MNFFKHKKAGGLTEITYLMVIMFVLAISLLIAVYVLDLMQPIMSESLTEPEVNETYQDFATRTPSSLDSMFMLCFVLLWIGAVILAFFVDTHPVWFIISLVGLVFVLMIAGVLSNTYAEVQSDLQSDGLTTSLPMTSYVMEYLVHFIIAIVFSIFVSLFAKSSL